MFKGGPPNPYDDIVNKTTDENLTSENWELILNLCDKVQDEGPEGARSVVAAVLRRLAHRSPNVQLYALSLAEALSKNCTADLHRELASRAFTQGLEKIITDRTTHDRVRRRALALVALWTAAFEHDASLGVMEDCYNTLKGKNYKFEAPEEAPPPAVDDEVRRREEEELQRVLEMSMQDKGGRGQWQGYAPAAGGPSGAAAAAATGASGSGAQLGRRASAAAAGPKAGYTAPTYDAGYSPARSASLKVQSAPAPAAAPAVASAAQVVTRVRALHNFEPTEPGELAFEKGDVIKVVDRGYKDWWRGQLKGRTGIFPVNYVDPMPEPTPAELAKEAEQEAVVFAQAANVDRLLTMLRSLDPAKDNLADNEDIQELYRSSMTLRPKIVKLIDKYSQKRADLVSMNETFVRAKTIFDRMMEESLARHSVYESQAAYHPAPYQARPDSRARARPEYAASPQPYGWTPVFDQPGYSAFPAAAAAPYAPGAPGPHAQPYADPAAYAQQQAPYAQAYVQPGVPYGPQGPTPYPAQPQTQPQPEQPAPQLGRQQSVQAQQQSPPQQPLAQQQHQPQPQTQPQGQGQQQVQTQAPQQQAGPAGPPYVYDPNATYADPNVQAWAQYYAQGGKELAGAIYFTAIPGVTDGSPQPGPAQPHPPALQQQPSAGPPASTEHAPFAQTQPQAQASPVNGYAAGTQPASPGAAPWAQPAHASPPGSPGQPSSSAAYQPVPAPSSGAQGAPAGQQAPQQHGQQQPYGQFGEAAQGPSAARSQSGSLHGREAAPSQYHALAGQFAGMGVGDGGPGAQAYQAPQGVGAG